MIYHSSWSINMVTISPSPAPCTLLSRLSLRKQRQELWQMSPLLQLKQYIYSASQQAHSSGRTYCDITPSDIMLQRVFWILNQKQWMPSTGMGCSLTSIDISQSFLRIKLPSYSAALQCGLSFKLPLTWKLKGDEYFLRMWILRSSLMSSFMCRSNISLRSLSANCLTLPNSASRLIPTRSMCRSSPTSPCTCPLSSLISACWAVSFSRLHHPMATKPTNSPKNTKNSIKTLLPIACLSCPLKRLSCRASLWLKESVRATHSDDFGLLALAEEAVLVIF